MKFDIFRRFAHDLAKESKCKRKQVGCIIYPPDFTQVLSIGYNGPPAHVDNNACSGDRKDCGCIHAEANAIAKLRDSGGILYCTHLPCARCAGLIINSQKINQVIYATMGSDARGLVYFRQAGIAARLVEYENVLEGF